MFSRLSRPLTFLTLSSCLVLFACNKKTGDTATSTPPADYCSTVISYAGQSPVTITGHAQYQYRTNGNGTVNGTPNPIRYAEVTIKDASGNIAQCAETDGSGDFSFSLPASSSSYTVYVNSRANNSFVKAYVMSDPTNNTHYKISGSITPTTSGAMATLTASATGTLEGGAFNILDQIVRANDYLRTEVSSANCSTINTANSFSDCVAFTVAPLLYAYWAKGFNPNTYLGGSSTNGVSFFLKGTNELYILGGIDGDVDESDCDHFDNAIILHEYGHFMEYAYGVSDSPGGSHGPNDNNDPRLVWSEGWANFFEAAVQSDHVYTSSYVPKYRDTYGNISSGYYGTFHNEDLEDGSYDTGANRPATNEGNFREFATTKALWDMIDDNSDAGVYAESVFPGAAGFPFAEVWTTFSGATKGFKASSPSSNSVASPRAVFRNIGLFYDMHDALASHTDWSTVIANQRQIANETDFATPIVTGSTCAATNILASSHTDGSYDNSDLFADNDFYAFYHPGGTLTVRLDYNSASSTAASQANLNLIVWKNNYAYGDTADIAVSARRSRAADTDGTATGGRETVTASLAAGWYMINVMVDNSAVTSPAPYIGANSTYKLYINGSQGCASP